jgi:hypothetical protein
MGLMQREKGKRFERGIASEIRERWPDAVVRRASQAERADNPDVFVEGGPPALRCLWLELQDAKSPTPAAKLEQAIRDVTAWQDRRGLSSSRSWARWPVVVWHRLGERTTWASLPLWVLRMLTGMERGIGDDLVVTLELSSLWLLVGAFSITPARAEAA